MIGAAAGVIQCGHERGNTDHSIVDDRLRAGHCRPSLQTKRSLCLHGGTGNLGDSLLCGFRHHHNDRGRDVWGARAFSPSRFSRTGLGWGELLW